MEETSWVRTIYLYAMCGIAITLVAIGSIVAVSGLVRAIAPDLGHRDTLDRVGIGMSNIASDVIDLAFENLQDIEAIEDFCAGVTDSDTDFEACVDDQTGASAIDAIQEGIGEVSDELRSQIRSNSIDTLIRGILLIAVGVVIWMLHGPRTALYGDGLVPGRRRAESTEPESTEPESTEPVAMEVATTPAATDEPATGPPDDRFPPPPSS